MVCVGWLGLFSHHKRARVGLHTAGTSWHAGSVQALKAGRPVQHQKPGAPQACCTCLREPRGIDARRALPAAALARQPLQLHFNAVAG